MPVQFQPVRPGDLITADLFNALLGRLAEIEDLLGGEGGLVEVPRLIGLTLGQAQSLLAQSGGGFVVDEALDAGGNALNPNTTEARARRVINQVPPPGARVAAAGAIDVILTASAEGTNPQPLPTPTISAISPRPVEVGAELTLSGTNFGSPPGLLQLRIEGQLVEPTLHSPQTLRFVVPALGAVPSAGREVEVVVSTAGGTATTGSLPAGARPRVIPTSGTLPAITGMADATGAAVPLDGSGTITVGQNVTISGQNFAPSAGQNQLAITTQSGEILRPVLSATASQLTFSVPELPGHSAANRFIQAMLAVQVGDSGANRSRAITLTFRRPA
jgi:hypothetical protein